MSTVEQVIETKLILRFTLPGVEARSCSLDGPNTHSQLQGMGAEHWELVARPENAEEVARVLRNLAIEIERTLKR